MHPNIDQNKRFGPTLMRRVFFAVLIAYPAIWIALMCNQFFIESRHLNKKIPEWLEQDIRTLDQYTNTQDALAFMHSAKRKYKSFRDIPPHYLELWTIDGKRVFFDEKRPYPHPPLANNPQQKDAVTINDTNYAILRRDGVHWSLRLARPLLSIADVIKRDTSEKTLNLAMLIAFPVLMLPIWLAIARGLLPLRVLSNRLAKREAEDLAPLDFDVKYGELKPVAMELDSLLLRLRGKVQSEQNFVQDAAHELRTPMAVISAQVHVLAKAANPIEKETAERHIDHAIARASHLIQQLLELARVDGLRTPDNSLQDIAQLVRLDLAQMVPAAMLRDIELSLEAPEALLYRLERNTFQSILQNLIDNAIRYGHVGGTVEVELKVEGDSLLLSVADDGPGIADDDRERVFERFYRGGGNDASGSGLGLAIVRQAALRMGATVELSTGINGQGCRFAVIMAAGID